MPLVTIWRDKTVTDEHAVAIRSCVHGAVVVALKVEREEVALRVRDLGPLDLNNFAVSIEIDTGTGKERVRVENRQALALQIQKELIGHPIVSSYPWMTTWKGSGVWLRICESAFVPIGDPDAAR